MQAMFHIMRNTNDNNSDNNASIMTTIAAITTDNDDPSFLWKRLQESQWQRVEQLKDEIKNLQCKRKGIWCILFFFGKFNKQWQQYYQNQCRMEDHHSVTQYSQYCVHPITKFLYMFSRWYDDSLIRDDKDHIFLDRDLQLIKIIVNFSSYKKDWRWINISPVFGKEDSRGKEGWIWNHLATFLIDQLFLPAVRFWWTVVLYQSKRGQKYSLVHHDERRFRVQYRSQADREHRGGTVCPFQNSPSTSSKKFWTWSSKTKGNFCPKADSSMSVWVLANQICTRRKIRGYLEPLCSYVQFC